MEKDCMQIRTVQEPLPGGTFVLDSKTGIRRKADSSRLALSLQTPSGLEPPGILIVAGAKGIKCIADLTGEKLGKAEWSGKSGTAQSAQVVEKMGALGFNWIRSRITNSERQGRMRLSFLRIGMKHSSIRCLTWNIYIPFRSQQRRRSKH
jgi:hypothetical protein